MPQAVSFSTAGLPTAQRIALWEEHNAHALIGLHCSMLGESELDATEINLQLDRLHLARVRGNPHVVERPAPLIRRHPSDSIAVYLTLVGEAFFYHSDGLLTLRPGQALICDADRPFLRGFSGGLEELAIKLPRAVFHELTGHESLPAPLVRDFTGGDVAAHTLARVAGRALRAEAPGPIDEDTALDLLGTLLGGRPRAENPVHLANAHAYIDEHLTDPGLSAARVAAAIGISERHLSRAFASAGPSFPQFVLARRLARAHDLLTRSPSLPVAAVSARCGFGTPSRFSQAFHSRFGLRPSDVRRSARARSAATGAAPTSSPAASPTAAPPDRPAAPDPAATSSAPR
jgi:AraC-like DNA-binding protein